LHWVRHHPDLKRKKDTMEFQSDNQSIVQKANIFQHIDVKNVQSGSWKKRHHNIDGYNINLSGAHLSG